MTTSNITLTNTHVIIDNFTYIPRDSFVDTIVYLPEIIECISCCEDMGHDMATFCILIAKFWPTLKTRLQDDVAFVAMMAEELEVPVEQCIDELMKPEHIISTMNHVTTKVDDHEIYTTLINIAKMAFKDDVEILDTFDTIHESCILSSINRS